MELLCYVMLYFNKTSFVNIVVRNLRGKIAVWLALHLLNAWGRRCWIPSLFKSMVQQRGIWERTMSIPNFLFMILFSSIFYFHCLWLWKSTHLLIISWARDFYTEAIAVLQPTRLCEPPCAFLSKPTSKWWVFEEKYVVKIPFHRIFVCFLSPSLST